LARWLPIKTEVKCPLLSAETLFSETAKSEVKEVCELLQLEEAQDELLLLLRLLMLETITLSQELNG